MEHIYVFFFIWFLFDTFELLTFLCTCPFLMVHGSIDMNIHHVGMVLYEDTSTLTLFYLYISLVLVRVRDTLCDIHMEYLKISF